MPILKENEQLSRLVSRDFLPLKICYSQPNRRVIIRPYEMQDAVAVQQAFEETLPILKKFMWWAYTPTNVKKQAERLERRRADYFAGGPCMDMGMFSAETGEFLTSTGYNESSTRLNPNSLEIGFWTASRHMNQGYATLAAQILIALAFEGIGCDRVSITHNKENIASQKVIERCGFHFEGTMRHALEAPTKEMVAEGYSSERTLCEYSLIPEDRIHLSWYTHLVDHLTVTTRWGVDLPLREIIHSTNPPSV